MNILSKLQEKFNTVEPIFDYEIEQMGYSIRDIEDTIEINVFEELKGGDFIPCRIFYLVGYSNLFNMYERLNDDSLSIIFKYFIGDNFEYGYIDGFCSLNLLKLSNQVCFSYKIKSCRVKTELSLNKIRILPEEENIDYKLLMCLKAFNEYKEAFDCAIDTVIKNIKEFLSEEQFNKFLKETRYLC